MKNLTIFILVFCMVVIGFGCGKVKAQKEAMGEAVDFELTDINGQAFRLSDHSGKVIILNFFATWCPPCRMEMPSFNELSQEYKNDVAVIAVNVSGEPVTKVKQFVDEYQLGFTVAIDNGTADDLYGPIRAIPVTVVIDKEFNIAKKYIGARPKEVFMQDIEELK